MKTDCMFNEKDLGKNLYTKKTYYTVMIEQHVIADNQAEADHKFTDFGGIDHDKINGDITETREGVETTVVDANYTDGGNTEYLGKIAYDPDDEYAEENGDVIIDPNAEEKPAEDKASDDFFPDARDQHLIRQDFNKAIGGK